MPDNGFTRTPLGRLAPTLEEIKSYKLARLETLTDTSKERKALLEDCASGFITKTELREELFLLKQKQEKS